jgi:hypothetical protein
MMTLSDIIEDLHALELRLLDYEKKYGLYSADFYDLYAHGFLDSGELEETIDYVRWAGLYEIRQDRKATFRQMSHDFVTTLRAQNPESSIRLKPNPELVAA